MFHCGPEGGGRTKAEGLIADVGLRPIGGMKLGFSSPHCINLLMRTKNGQKSVQFHGCTSIAQFLTHSCHVPELLSFYQIQIQGDIRT